jgi:hypothetical protein
MKIYTALHKGQQHPDFCGDFLLTLNLGEGLFVGVVSDGCSGGRDPHLASTLTCKLIRKIVRGLAVEGHTQPETLANQVLGQFMEELRAAQTQLGLETNELLATLMLLVYSQAHQQAHIAALGDGAICFDNQIYQIDQDNVPDYPAYHLQDPEEGLQSYLYQNTFTIENPAQVSIATDGIFSFRPTEPGETASVMAPVEYLLKNRELPGPDDLLNRKLTLLRNSRQLEPVDDLAIIQLLID